MAAVYYNYDNMIILTVLKVVTFNGVNILFFHKFNQDCS